jgi:ketol-acid reductoisomerase
VQSGNGVVEGFLFKPWIAVCEETEFVILSENVVLVGTLKDDVERQYKTYLETRGNPPEEEDEEIEEWVATTADYLKKNNLLN